jgi:hypothetical protein
MVYSAARAQAPFSKELAVDPPEDFVSPRPFTRRGKSSVIAFGDATSFGKGGYGGLRRAICTPKRQIYKIFCLI